MATKTASASDAPSDINILLRALGLAGEGESADAHFDHRASHAHPFYMSPVFVAVATGTTPELHEEDEVRWNTALGCAQFDTKSIEILSPGIDGQNWAERVITYTLAIAGRQTHSKANDITQGPDSGQVFQVSVENLKKWITEEPHPDRERSIIIVGDQLATQCKLWLGDVGSSFHRNPRMVSSIDVVKLYSDAMPEAAGVAGLKKLRYVCKSLGIEMADNRNVGHRAKCALHAMITIAVKASATRSPRKQTKSAATALPSFLSGPIVWNALPSAQGSTSSEAPDTDASTSSETDAKARSPPAQAEQAKDIEQVTSDTKKQSDVQLETKATPVSPLSDATKPAAGPAVKDAAVNGGATSANTSSPRAPIVAPGTGQEKLKEREWATEFPETEFDDEPSDLSDWGESAFTKWDKSGISYSNGKINKRPGRICYRYRKYSDMTREFTKYLLERAAETGFSGLSAIQETVTDHDKKTYVKLSDPHCFGVLAKHVNQHRRIPVTVTDALDEIVRLRGFVANWYVSMQEELEVPSDSVMAEETREHISFAVTLRGLRAMLLKA